MNKIGKISSTEDTDDGVGKSVVCKKARGIVGTENPGTGGRVS